MRRYEKEAAAQGFRFILGLDEAGRGPLAGPVVAAAVHLTTQTFRTKIDDSKKMTAKARDAAFHEIWDSAYVGIGIVSEVAIDEVNILNASFLAMDAAARQLLSHLPPDIITDNNLDGNKFDSSVMLLVDGNRYRTSLPYASRTIVGGDACCLSIACASIIAKVYRDRVMGHYDRVFPQYGFKQHKGYGTLKHRQALEQHGPCRLHRRTFLNNYLNYYSNNSNDGLTQESLTVDEVI